jgi:hypothetical protein
MASHMASGVSAASGNVMMRPRANTISHIDGNLLQRLPNALHHGSPMYGHQTHASIAAFSDLGSIPQMAAFSFHHGPSLPRIETAGLGMNIDGGMRTAPIFPNHHFEWSPLFTRQSSSTIDPSQLHIGSTGEATPVSPYAMSFPSLDTGNTTWAHMEENFHLPNSEAIMDQSSPSEFGTGSASGFSDIMIDGSNNKQQPSSVSAWQPQSIVVTSAQFANDPITPALFHEFAQPHTPMTPSTISPNDLHEQNNMESFMSLSNGHMRPMSPVPGSSSLQAHYFQQPLTFGSGPNAESAQHGVPSPGGGGGPAQPLTPMWALSITDATRQALLYSLSQPTGYGQASRRISLSSATPLSPGFTSGSGSGSHHQVSLPSTADLRRYVSAYMIYFHPHMPFLHLPSLSFDSPAFTNTFNSAHTFGDGIARGGGCLILAMAAIGASYEYEHGIANDLFEHAKSMIILFLDNLQQRRSHTMMTSGPPKTPLWLVQAMLLNIIYGHQCGDRKSAEIATTHCASLVSLAKAARLDEPDTDLSSEETRAYMLRHGSPTDELSMDEDAAQRSWRRASESVSRDEFSAWFRWKSFEERKRTLFSVYILSSLLVTAYNHHPRILNSELNLELPCEESLWAADSPSAWTRLKATSGEGSKPIMFSAALSRLLNTSTSHPKRPHRRTASHQASGSSVPLDQVPLSNLQLSTFACYVLINALHVSIWETRQGHNGAWKAEQTEKLRDLMEPALREWQAAWRSNPTHVLERPNPYGPLPADSIPLLDLAYVRLFVNLGRSKEAFWTWDFEAMADELAAGSDMLPATSDDSSSSDGLSNGVQQLKMAPPEDGDGAGGSTERSKRERHLRKAAFYAADSLSMAHKLGVTFAEFTSRELPIQAAMCTFDCAQVLAEWLVTVQERAGQYIGGIMGMDPINYASIECLMMLEHDDFALIAKVEDILNNATGKIATELTKSGQSPEEVLTPMRRGGYGFQLLMVTAYMLDRAQVWGSKFLQQIYILDG